MMAVEIKQTLEREYEIFLTAQDIRGLNFAKLQEMASKTGASKKRGGDGEEFDESITGMKLLVRVVGTEDISPEICLPLKTKQEENKSEIFLIPGIEGIGRVFNNLAPKINAPACCLQLGISDATQNSINAMVDKLLPV